MRDRLNQLLETGLSQAAIAKAMSTSPQHVARIRRGAPVSVKIACRVAKAGYIQLEPFLAGDLTGAHPSYESPRRATLRAEDVTQQRSDLDEAKVAFARLPMGVQSEIAAYARPRLADMPGFSRALRKARLTWGRHFDEEVWEFLGDCSIDPLPPSIDAEDLYHLAVWFSRPGVEGD